MTWQWHRGVVSSGGASAYMHVDVRIRSRTYRLENAFQLQEELDLRRWHSWQQDFEELEELDLRRWHSWQQDFEELDLRLRLRMLRRGRWRSWQQDQTELV